MDDRGSRLRTSVNVWASRWGICVQTPPRDEPATKASICWKRRLVQGWAGRCRALPPAQVRTLVALWLRLSTAMSCGAVTSLSRQVISRVNSRSRSVSAWSSAVRLGSCAPSSRFSGSGSYGSSFSSCGRTSSTAGFSAESENELLGAALLVPRRRSPCAARAACSSSRLVKGVVRLQVVQWRACARCARSPRDRARLRCG